MKVLTLVRMITPTSLPCTWSADTTPAAAVHSFFPDVSNHAKTLGTNHSDSVNILSPLRAHGCYEYACIRCFNMYAFQNVRDKTRCCNSYQYCHPILFRGIDKH